MICFMSSPRGEEELRSRKLNRASYQGSSSVKKGTTNNYLVKRLF
jgi:hypothetical protein